EEGMLRSCGIWMVVILGMILVGYIGYRMSWKIVGGPNLWNYERTITYDLGTLHQGLSNQSEIKVLVNWAHGDRYSGNTSLDEVASKQVYRMSEKNIPNVVGPEGVLHLYNESTFMTSAMVEAAAEYWNLLAGETIVEIVDQHRLCDEVIHD